MTDQVTAEELTRREVAAEQDFVDVVYRQLDVSTRAAEALALLAKRAPLADDIASFWLEPRHRAGPAWTQHADINDVMLATTLAPEGFVIFDGRPMPTPGVATVGSPTT